MSQEIPGNATAITTEDLLAAIGELYVQTRVMRRMIDAAKGQGEVSNNNNVERQESKIGI